MKSYFLSVFQIKEKASSEIISTFGLFREDLFKATRFGSVFAISTTFGSKSTNVIFEIFL